MSKSEDSAVKVLRQMLTSHLDSRGGVLSDQVPIILEIMETCAKHSERLCMINTFRATRSCSILIRIMKTGGWDILYDWLLEAKEDADNPQLVELLHLYKMLPINMEILTTNGCVGEMKRLIRFDDDRIARMSKAIFQAWKTYKLKVDNGTGKPHLCSNKTCACNEDLLSSNPSLKSPPDNLDLPSLGKPVTPTENAPVPTTDRSTVPTTDRSPVSRVSESAGFVNALQPAASTYKRKKRSRDSSSSSSISSVPALSQRIDSKTEFSLGVSPKEGLKLCDGAAFLDGLMAGMATLVTPPGTRMFANRSPPKFRPNSNITLKQKEWDTYYSEDAEELSEPPTKKRRKITWAEDLTKTMTYQRDEPMIDISTNGASH